MCNKKLYNYIGNIPGRTNTKCVILDIFCNQDYVNILFIDNSVRATTTPNMLIEIEENSLDIKIIDTDQPKDKKIWCVDLCGFDIGCLNSYMLTYDEALKMCHTSFDNDEGSNFIVYVPDEHKIRKEKCDETK